MLQRVNSTTAPRLVGAVLDLLDTDRLPQGAGETGVVSEETTMKNGKERNEKRNEKRRVEGTKCIAEKLLLCCVAAFRVIVLERTGAIQAWFVFVAAAAAAAGGFVYHCVA